jgi:hypothetical protein
MTPPFTFSEGFYSISMPLTPQQGSVPKYFGLQLRFASVESQIMRGLGECAADTLMCSWLFQQVTKNRFLIRALVRRMSHTLGQGNTHHPLAFMLFHNLPSPRSGYWLCRCHLPRCRVRSRAPTSLLQCAQPGLYKSQVRLGMSAYVV